jgi:hypothetical protein
VSSLFEFLEGFLERSNPALIIGGVALALFTSPQIRKTTRKTLVKGMAAVMSLANEASQMGTKAKEEWQSMVAETQEQMKMKPTEEAPT